MCLYFLKGGLLSEILKMGHQSKLVSLAGELVSDKTKLDRAQKKQSLVLIILAIHLDLAFTYRF